MLTVACLLQTRPCEPSVLWEYIALLKAGKKPKEAHTEALAQVGQHMLATVPLVQSVSSVEMDGNAGADADSDSGSSFYEDVETKQSGTAC